MKVICEKISKGFVTSNGVVRVLEEFSVDTQHHDLVCILGPNGCGKSTLLKIIAGLVEPSQGRVVFDGVASARLPATLVFQEDGLFPWLNVLDNACFGLEMRGVPRKERYEMAQQLIVALGLVKFSVCYPHQLSTGMKQKVSLIRGLLTDAPVVLMDEPDKSLDIYSKIVMCEDIHRVWEEYQKTVICVTHDIDMALKLSRTIWVLGKSPAAIVKNVDVAGARQNSVLLEALRKDIQEIIRQEAEKAA